MKKVFFLALLLSTIITYAQITPHEANRGMLRGINLGNTLEPPYEGSWNNGPVQEYYFDDYKEAGFTSVRIPVRWDNHTQRSAPYTVDSDWMDRVEQIVDWALERDLFVVINAHHEEWIKTGYNQQDLRDRFDSIWSQIAVKFQNKSDKLLFEMINEPNGLTLGNINELNARILSIIRQTNPTRIVIFSGHRWSNAEELVAAEIPDDPYIMGYFHSYDPYLFGLEGQGTWGTTADLNAMQRKFKLVKDWSEANNIPVTINEFGAINRCEYNSRMYHYASYVEEAIRSNFSFNAWDDGGDFRIYQRASRGWNDIKDILIYTDTHTPTKLNISTYQDSVFQLSWENRHEYADSIFIERRYSNNSFEKYASLPPDASEFLDYNISTGEYYYYRVNLHYTDSINTPSYPIRGLLLPYEREPYHGEPYTIPCVIQAEDYDIGGEGLTYHDKTSTNRGGAYRTDEAVDIEERPDGGYQVSYVEPGEWMEYTLDVEEQGLYNFTVYVASMEGGGRMTLTFGFRSLVLNIPSTNSWTTLSPVEGEFELNEGLQAMRLRIISIPEFNIDRIEISKKNGSSVNNQLIEKYKLFSNREKTITLNINNDERGTVTFYNVLGREITKRIINSDKNEYQVNHSGIILYTIKTNQGNFYSGKVRVK